MVGIREEKINWITPSVNTAKADLVEVQQESVDPSTLTFGLHFVPWTEIRNNLPKPRTGYSWQMKLTKRATGASYNAASEFYRAPSSARKGIPKDLDIVIEITLIGPNNRMVAQHFANMTGRKSRVRYTDTHLQTISDYPRSGKEMVYEDVVTDTIVWAKRQLDLVIVNEYQKINTQSVGTETIT